MAKKCCLETWFTTTNLLCTGFFVKGGFLLYSTLLHLPPLRFRCVGGCWDRTQYSHNRENTADDEEKSQEYRRYPPYLKGKLTNSFVSEELNNLWTELIKANTARIHSSDICS
jgi:hypothetical protein